jgi:hypothetical protein
VAPGRVRAARLDQPGVRIGGDQRNPGQAAGDEVLEEGVPAGTGLAGRRGDTEDLAVAIGVDAGGDHGRDLDHSAALADLHRQRIRGDERVRALVQWPLAEVPHELVEVTGHHRHLGLRQAGDAQRLHESIHAPRGDPQQVTGRHHRGECCLGAAAPLEQPLGK